MAYHDYDDRTAGGTQGPRYVDPGHPYSGSGNRYPNNSASDKPFQFPWWAVLIGFVTWWPLGFVFLIVNSVLKNQSAQNRGARPQPFSATDAQRRASGPAYAAPNAARDTQPAPRTEKKPKEKQNDDAKWARILLVAGIVVAAVGGVATLSTVAEMAAWAADGMSVGWMVEDLITGLGFLVAGGGMCFGARRMHVSLRMRKKIANIVGKADSMYIEDIAGSIPCSYDKCCKYLEGCIAKGVFGDEAYLDMRTRTLVVRGKPPVREEPAPAPEPKAEADSKYGAILQQLRQLNDRIPGEEMSDKIDRLEKVSAKIFAQAESNPEKLPQMRKFLDYYLPTSVKLLKTYAELDEQGVEGENITDSKRRIEQTMDTLVVAFEKQLDQLFENDALDVSTDIDVMQNMLAADGLTTDDPFELHKPGE
ncbi:MAG: 5-bromo-4-chloroindolyl phosphate hydrolysis family protein [Gemmiger sp.]